MKKKICSLVMCCALFTAMLPSTVLADVEASATGTEETVVSEIQTDEVSVDSSESVEDGTVEVEIAPETDWTATADEDVDAEAYTEDVEETEAEIGAEEEGTAGDEEDVAAIEDAEADEVIDAAEDAADDLDAEDEEESGEDEDAETEEDEDAEEVIYTAESDGVIVEVTAPAGALPEGAELVAQRYAEDSEEYMEAAEAIDYESTDENGMAALDISFYYDGEEIEPTEAVKVSIDVSQILPSDADASSIEVQHLVEIEDGDDVILDPVVVADDSGYTEGTIDEENAVAEFEVDSFSAFTVSWTITNGPQAGSSYTVNVTAYLDGTELDGITGLTFSSENDELDFETLLSDLDYGTGDYTFSYAIGTIGNVTYGSEENSIAAVEIVTGTGTGGGGGQTTYFRIVYMDGSYVDVATSSELNISAYYTTPSLSVEIVAVDEDEAEDWELQAVVSHAADGSTLTYEWWVTDKDGNETSLAHVSNTDNTGEAFIVWDEGVVDNDEVVVHVRVTETDAGGSQIATAEASYTLEYGDETVDLIMTYGPNQTALPAGVTVTLNNEATGQEYIFTTSDDGWVHDAEIEPGIYIVSATYTVDGNTYQCNTEISLHDAGNYSINLDYYNPDILTSVPDKNDWEHIDIKLSIGTSGSASAEGVTLNITSATIYTSGGEVRATTTDVTGNDNEFQLHWSTGDGNTHSTSFSSTDYIVINYTLTENDVTTSYSITIGPDTVYAAGTTYPVDGQRAYKLYNYLYGTSYQSDSQLIAAGIDDIDISGMSLFLVAAILCDSSEVTGAGQLDVSSAQAGLDFALSINTINELATSWQFEVEKTYYNASMLAGNFEFVLYDATAEGDTWTQGSANSTLTNSQAGIGQEGYSQDTMESLAIAYSDEDIQNEVTYYYILSETPNTVTSESGATITFDETVYGIKVQLGKEGEGDDETATITVTYYILTGRDGTYTAQEYTGDKIDINSETGEPTFKFENTYQEYVTISGTKVWVDSDDAADKRPESITINLLKNGSAALDDEGNPITVTVTGEGNSWNWSFINLPVWDGVTQNVYSVSENITVDGYTVTITQDETTGEYTITNTYVDTTSEIQVAKSYVDSEGEAIDTDEWPEGGFEFTLTAISGVDADETEINSSDVPMPDNTTVTATNTDAVSFGEITYTAEGTYYYQISETPTSEDYITDDANYHYVKVVVTADADTGVLSAAVSYLTSDVAITDFTDDNYNWSNTDTYTTFTNYYTSNETGSLNITKYVVESADDAILALPFRVTVTAQLENGETIDLSGVIVTVDGQSITATISSEDGTISFDITNGQTVNISGLPVGDYMVEETTSARDEFRPVYSVDGEETEGAPTVTVTADTEEEGSTVSVEIENEYPADTYIRVQKNYNGVFPTGENAFSFTIEALSCELEASDVSLEADEMPMPSSTTVTVTDGTAVSFGDMEFVHFGTYYYKITENKGTLEYVTYDTSVYYVKIVVTDSHEVADEGYEVETVTASYAKVSEETDNYQNLTYTEAETIVTAEFENTYDASGNVTLTATKEYTGATLTANQFNFTITETTAGVEEENLYSGTGTNDAEGNISFTPEITYGLSDVGTHTYEIAENVGNAGGVTYDSDTITVTVAVSDNGDGTLATTVTVGEDGIEATDGSYNVGTFKNKYEATGSVTLSATKAYTGADLTEGLFSFTVTETTTGVDEDDLYTGTGTNDTSGNITFTPAISYTQDDVGMHTYEIAETAGTAGGVTYDSNKITVTVTVSDNGDGMLTTTVTVSGEGITAGTDGSYNVGTFNNSYEATGSVTLTATKTISGMSSTVKTFNFTLYNSNENFNYNLGDTRSTASTTNTLTEGEAQTVSFPSITYNAAGTYYFVIVESSTGTEGDGWTYDSTEYHVTVVMTDDGNGNLIPTVTYEYVDENGDTQTTNSADFANTYKAAETAVQFAGTKYISNSNGTDKVFTFELYETEDSSFDTTGVTPEEVKTSGSINANGQDFEFDEITYEEAGTHYYVIKEQELDDASGWTISETVYYITVEVTDNLAGQLVATVSYVTEIGGDSTTVTGSEDVYDGFDFTNTYAATGSVGLTAVKSLSGRATSDSTFTFALYNSDASFADGSQIETQSTSGTIDASQQVSFTDLEYEYDSSNTYPMNYYYIIKETTTDSSGWTCDTGEYHVTVTVTDNGTGTLTTSPSYVYVAADGTTNSADNATFTNSYAATGALNLSGTKTFEGGTITDGQFTYTVMEGETQVATGTVDADGTITFTQIDYTYSDVGEHTYIITEDAGSDTSVQYDTTEYTVVVTVTDNETGELTVSYTANGEESGSIDFTNYQKGSLTINKSFTGLTDDQIASLTDFTITVTNSAGDTVATLTMNDADEGTSYTWTLSNLVADTYTVTESGYSLDGYEVIAKSGEVELKTDGTDASMDDTLAWGGEDTVAFINDYTEVGTITISKYVTAEKDIQKEHEDTEYTVVITSSEDADFQWVTVTSDSGREITPTINGKTITFTIIENETVTISGLPAGKYTVEEQGSDAMTSEHCVPNYRIGDDDYENPPTVTVASGEENIVSIEIDNEYPIGTYIMVQKNYNKDEYPEEGFTFTIEALSCDLDAEGVTLTADEMPMPESTTLTMTGSNVGYIGLITFGGDNEFEHFGTYYYKITETMGSEENIDYDTSVHYIKVVVEYDQETHLETTDEWEAKADAETENYKDLDYTEAGIVTAEFTNTAYEELSIEKEVSGNAGDTSEYEFEITLTNSDGTPFEGTVTMSSSSDVSPNRVAAFLTGLVKAYASDDTLTFEDGEATVTIAAGETITIMIPSGVTCTVTEVGSDADSVNVSVNGVYQAQSSTSEATADVGTVADSTQVKFVNSYRQYFGIDEEIVTDTDDIFDRDAWVKDEAVNEYNAIEIEMTTNLPVVTAYDLENGAFTMNFHEVLDHELVLDEDTADFTVYIGGNAISTAYYRITFDEETGDDCNFHVDVDLTALYNDGIVTDDMLDGNTEITIFFFADLEGTGLNGSYTSTVWYDIYDGDEWLYTSDVSVVEVYTYEIEIRKYDTETDEDLAGATLGVYYDEDGENPVSRNGEDYTVVSGDDGQAIFYGLADGTYYVKEVEAPSGYVLSDEVLTVELGEDLNDSGYAYTGEYANTPEKNEDTVNINGAKTWNDSDDSFGARPDSITVRLLADGEEVDSVTVTADDDWAWTFADMPKYQEDGKTEIAYTITEDAVDSYTTTIDGYDVTNTFTPPTDEPIPTPEDKTMNIKVTKVWEGDSEYDRPASVEISLLVSGEVCDTATLNADNDWTYTWSDLPVYDEEGTAIQYTIKEASVPEGYRVSYGDWQSSDGTYTIIVTNTFDLELLTGPGPADGNPGSSTPEPGNPVPTAKTSDPGLPTLPLAGCFAAVALIAAALVVRRRRVNE